MNKFKNCRVKLYQGILTGVEESLPNGRLQRVFRGIPYAEPPIGANRFRLPVPLKKLPDLDCSKERNVCVQYDMITKKLVGSEDCLYLNVYSPKIDFKEAKLPVMVFIHGGGFATGSGNSNLYSPDFLVQENVVVVTCNYRLGPFGFLHLPNAGIHGNAGLYDQLLVLQWINENIVKFNGDPNNVTLFGESAGAVSTHIHLMSSLSRKYFHRAICQSGTIAMDWVIPRGIVTKSRQLGGLLGCKSNDDKEILKYLQNFEGNQILEKVRFCKTEDELWRGLPFQFVPSFGKNQDIYLKYPNESIRKTDNLNIPIMIGYNSHEGIIVVQNIVKKLKEYENDLQKTIPLSINLTINSSSSIKLGEEIKKFYYRNKVNGELTASILGDIITDTQFVNGVKISLESLKIFQKDSPIYAYRFSFDGELNLMKHSSGIDFKGASHVDELFYLFRSRMFDFEIDENSETDLMRKRMCKLWTNFAKFGNPTPDDDYDDDNKKLINFKWLPIDNKKPHTENLYLSIGDKIEMVKDIDGDRFNFWKKVYERWNGSLFKPKL